MVLLFLIASVHGEVPHSLFYRYYEELSKSECATQNQNNMEEGNGLSANQTHRQQIHRLVELLHSHYEFHSATSATKNLERDILDREDGQHHYQDIDVCCFRLKKMDPFSLDMRVVWLSINGLAFALVCYHYENRLSAEMILKLLTRHLNDFCRIIVQPSEIFSKPEKIQLVLDKFLPYGQLLFINHRLIRQLERETETAMKGVAN